MLYKHYVKIDGENRVIKPFSDAFEQPVEGDKFIKDSDDRFYDLPCVKNIDGSYNWKWDENSATIVERTQEEKQVEINAQRKTELFVYIQDLQKQLDALANLKVYTDMPELDINAKMAEIETARDTAIIEYNTL